MIVFLDRQHTGKPDPRWVRDMGAAHDLDRDGVIETWEREAMLTGQYGLHCEGRLRELGHVPIPISDGLYSPRHARVNEYAAQLAPNEPSAYVAEHVNSGGRGKDYGLVLFDHRSTQGLDLARHVADALTYAVDELSTVKVIAAAPGGPWSNAYRCIVGVGRPVAIVYEPAFLDCPAHRPLFENQGLRRLGAALAEGINAWGSA